ncbi:MAG: hypothetical protein K2X81_18090, partial [Candidatus Obscuribacterales bacterium]|nr:hypothetical protein [Candidatus Obscuribacterales bacterium]
MPPTSLDYRLLISPSIAVLLRQAPALIREGNGGNWDIRLTDQGGSIILDGTPLLSAPGGIYLYAVDSISAANTAFQTNGNIEVYAPFGSINAAGSSFNVTPSTPNSGGTILLGAHTNITVGQLNAPGSWVTVWGGAIPQGPGHITGPGDSPGFVKIESIDVSSSTPSFSQVQVADGGGPVSVQQIVGNGSNISLISAATTTISAINNTSTFASGGSISIFGKNVSVGSIVNDCPNGYGGSVSISSNNSAGVVTSIPINCNAGFGGGSVSISNIGGALTYNGGIHANGGSVSLQTALDSSTGHSGLLTV